MQVFFDILLRDYNLPIFLKYAVLLSIATLVTWLRARTFDLSSSTSLTPVAVSQKLDWEPGRRTRGKFAWNELSGPFVSQQSEPLYN